MLPVYHDSHSQHYGPYRAIPRHIYSPMIRALPTLRPRTRAKRKNHFLNIGTYASGTSYPARPPPPPAPRAALEFASVYVYPDARPEARWRPALCMAELRPPASPSSRPMAVTCEYTEREAGRESSAYISASAEVAVLSHRWCAPSPAPWAGGGGGTGYARPGECVIARRVL